MSKQKRQHGSQHWNAIFDADTVREIRAAREKVPQTSITALAAKYRTNKQTIRDLLKGKTYKDVK